MRLLWVAVAVAHAGVATLQLHGGHDLAGVLFAASAGISLATAHIS